MEGRGVWGLAWRGQLGSLTRHRFVLCYDALVSPGFGKIFLRGALRRPMLGLYKTELFCSIFHSHILSYLLYKLLFLLHLFFVKYNTVIHNFSITILVAYPGT